MLARILRLGRTTLPKVPNSYKNLHRHFSETFSYRKNWFDLLHGHFDANLLRAAWIGLPKKLIKNYFQEELAAEIARILACINDDPQRIEFVPKDPYDAEKLAFLSEIEEVLQSSHTQKEMQSLLSRLLSTTEFRFSLSSYKGSVLYTFIMGTWTKQQFLDARSRMKDPHFLTDSSPNRESNEKNFKSLQNTWRKLLLSLEEDTLKRWFADPQITRKKLLELCDSAKNEWDLIRHKAIFDVLKKNELNWSGVRKVLLKHADSVEAIDNSLLREALKVPKDRDMQAEVNQELGQSATLECDFGSMIGC